MPLVEFSWKGLSNALAESKTPQDHAFSMENCDVQAGILQLAKRYGNTWAPPSWSTGCIGLGFGYGRYTGNELQTLTATPVATGGTFTLTWTNPDGSTTQTPAIDWDTDAVSFQDALEQMTNIALGDVICGGGPFPTTPLTVEFSNNYSNLDVATLALSGNSLLGASPSIAIAETIKGGLQEEYLAAIQYPAEDVARLYSINTAGTFTLLASSLNASDWHFIQYKRKIYAANQYQEGIVFQPA